MKNIYNLFVINKTKFIITTILYNYTNSGDFFFSNVFVQIISTLSLQDYLDCCLIYTIQARSGHKGVPGEFPNGRSNDHPFPYKN